MGIKGFTCVFPCNSLLFHIGWNEQEAWIEFSSIIWLNGRHFNIPTHTFHCLHKTKPLFMINYPKCQHQHHTLFWPYFIHSQRETSCGPLKRGTPSATPSASSGTVSRSRRPCRSLRWAPRTKKWGKCIQMCHEYQVEIYYINNTIKPKWEHLAYWPWNSCPWDHWDAWDHFSKPWTFPWASGKFIADRRPRLVILENVAWKSRDGIRYMSFELSSKSYR